MKYNSIFFVILILGSFLAFFMLGHNPLIDNDEAFYAQVVKESVQNGNYITLTQSGNNWFDKPPLIFWMDTVLVKIFGFSEFILRFPSSLLLIFCLILVYGCAYEITGKKRVAILSMLILLTTGLFLEAGRQLRLDVPVTAFILFSFYSFLRGLRQPRWFMGIGVGIGLGIMTKSVIGFFSIPAIILCSLFFKKWNYLRDRNFYFGLLLGGIIGLPWHIYEWLKYPIEFSNLYIMKFIFVRIQENILGGVSTNAVYVMNLINYYEPWFIIFFVCLIGIFIAMKKYKQMFRVHLLFLSIIICLSFVFFISSTKLLYYFIPIYPFVAIFIALSFDSFLSFVEKFYLKHKDFVIFTYSLIFIFSFIVTIYISFGFGNNYFAQSLNLAQQEKSMGEIMNKNSTSTPIYIHMHAYWDTIAYYSGGRRPQAYDEKITSRPFYLILPSQLKLQAKILYEGNDLSLYLVQ
ncbi:MAG: glycosyltransferase family 39 protein [Patescibacteria group bacterium]|nr:glycosyltransferase family 39 protein [Patescibacteria group bacterium]